MSVSANLITDNQVTLTDKGIKVNSTDPENSPFGKLDEYGYYKAPPDCTFKNISVPPTPTDDLFRLHHNICDRAKSIMRAKNADYTAQSSDPFANFRGSTYLGIDPVLGILLRMQDKLMRLRSFAEHGELKVVDEGIEDTAIDVVNYTILALAMLKERKQ